MKSGSKKNPPYRVTSRMVPRTRAWMLDDDYWDKLSPENQKWLAQFEDEYYRADNRYPKPMHTSMTDRYAMQNANTRDVYSRVDAIGGMEFLGQDLPPDFEGGVVDEDALALAKEEIKKLAPIDPATYTVKLEYKQVLQELRKLVDVPASRRTKKEDARIKMLQTYLQSEATGGNTN